MKPEAPLVRLQGVGFRYPGAAREALQGLDLDLPPGRITAVLGPNGSGKTTLLHLLLGLYDPTAGEAALEGRPWGEVSRRARARLLCLVPQEEPISFPISVGEYALLGRAPHLGLLAQPGPEDRAAALRALEDAGIAHLKDRSMMELSGGERQLCTVARALAQQTRLVLMDEPTSHLDLGNTRRVLDLMARVRASGRAVVFTTHDPNAALAVAEKAMLLKHGRMVACGHARDVLTAEALGETFGVDVTLLEHERRRVVVVCGQGEGG
ncbi:MAG: ABC transporter ATP-binding protein [Pseudomonadota bacterium]